MSKKKIYVIDINKLQDIFDEIKTDLDYEFIFKKNLNFLKIELNQLVFDKSVLFIVSSKYQNDLEKKINKKKIIIFDKNPLIIQNLIENINITFLKLNYNYQSKIILKDYILNLNSKEIKKEKNYLKLTEREIEIILFLFNKKKATNIKDLQINVWHQKKDLETHTVETHIYRLRKKFNKTFRDFNFISSVKDGYII